MWQRRRGNDRRERGGADPGGRRRRGWRGRTARADRDAWRMDPEPDPQVAWESAPELTPRAVPVDAVPSPSPWSAGERLAEAMPSIYCPRCGAESPGSARFCANCGAPLPRGGAERPGESTSTISLGGAEPADIDQDESLADASLLEGLAPGSALLIVKRGPNAGSRFLLDHDLTTVGRHPGSHIFLDDVTVSRRHAEFYRQGASFSVRDVGSLNGTYVNRDRIEEARLADGDEVQVGKFRLMFVGGRRSSYDRGGGGAQVGA